MLKFSEENFNPLKYDYEIFFESGILKEENKSKQDS
jgi:hypothetical protein